MQMPWKLICIKHASNRLWRFCGCMGWEDFLPPSSYTTGPHQICKRHSVHHHHFANILGSSCDIFTFPHAEHEEWIWFSCIMVIGCVHVLVRVCKVVTFLLSSVRCNLNLRLLSLKWLATLTSLTRGRFLEWGLILSVCFVLYIFRIIRWLFAIYISVFNICQSIKFVYSQICHSSARKACACANTNMHN